jgi:hypothetical protein
MPDHFAIIVESDMNSLLFPWRKYLHGMVVLVAGRNQRIAGACELL